MSYWQAPEAVWEDEEVARQWAGAVIDAALRAKAETK